MPTRLILSLCVLATLAGCARISESRLNPFNWFSGAQSDAESFVPPDPVEADPRPLVAQVTALQVARTPGGAIIRATGLPPTQGFYGAGLLVEDFGEPQEGVLTYQFRVVPPPETARVSTRQSREIIVGQFLSNQALEGVRVIRVVGASNVMSTRR